MEGGWRRQVGSVYENVSKESVFANPENTGKCQKGERCRPVCGPGHPLPCSPPVDCRTLSCSSRLDPRACLEHMAGTRLTSGKSIVAMRFLPTPFCYPADPSLCFSQSFPLTRWWSQLKTLIQHSDPPPCHSESFSMSESSLLPSLQPRMK